MYAFTILVPLLLALDAMFAAPFAGIIGLIMIFCLSGYDNNGPIANSAALIANTIVATGVKYAFGGGVLREIHGLVLMGACKDSWGPEYPSAITVAVTMIMHKFLTCDEYMFYFDFVMIGCSIILPLRQIATQALITAFALACRLYSYLYCLLVGIPQIVVFLYNSPVTLWRQLCRTFRKPKMVNASTQTDPQIQPQPTLTLSAVMTVADIAPISPPEPPKPTVYSHEAVTEIFRKVKPRITFLRRSSILRDDDTTTGLVDEMAPVPGQTISSREYLRNLWAAAKQPCKPQLSKETPKTEEPTSDQPSTQPDPVEQPSIEQPAINQRTLGQFAVEQSVANPPTPEESICEEPIPEKSITQVLTPEGSITEEPIPDESILKGTSREEVVAEEPTAEEAMSKEASQKAPIADQLASEESISNESSIEDSTLFGEPTADDYTLDESAGKEPTTNQPKSEETTSDEVSQGKPVPNELAPEESISDESSLEDPTLFGEPTADEYIFNESTSEECNAEQPIVEQNIPNEPIPEASASEEPIPDTYDSEGSLFGEPTADEYILDESTSEEPTAKPPILEETIMEAPIPEEPIAEQSIAKQGIAEEAILEMPIQQESAPEEPTLDDSSSEGSLFGDPAPEEYILGVPAAEEPVAEGPAKEQDEDERFTSGQYPVEPISDEQPVKVITEDTPMQGASAEETPPERLVVETSEGIKAIEDFIFENLGVGEVGDYGYFELPENWEEEGNKIIDELWESVALSDFAQPIEGSQFNGEQAGIQEPHSGTTRQTTEKDDPFDGGQPTQSHSRLEFNFGSEQLPGPQEHGPNFTFRAGQSMPTIDEEELPEAEEPASMFNFNFERFTPTSSDNQKSTEAGQSATIFTFGAGQPVQPEQSTVAFALPAETSRQAPQTTPSFSFGSEQPTEAEWSAPTFTSGAEQPASVFNFNGGQSQAAEDPPGQQNQEGNIWEPTDDGDPAPIGEDGVSWLDLERQLELELAMEAENEGGAYEGPGWDRDECLSFVIKNIDAISRCDEIETNVEVAEAKKRLKEERQKEKNDSDRQALMRLKKRPFNSFITPKKANKSADIQQATARILVIRSYS
ncbi:uncharacterized protein F4812DRAFT_463367 [Daldinia caldariorum]|uniref:uncharacterized protein n=1 Tax=Daldinia caldariorum TaxID=326644 RepID=UPI00200818BF|nr:uncharacterized protein F4812DRAFT_463367 [Daldinia caldariorum]KAI1463805.1 hypothetical protein F4812DRAFT_463367 [Daldinia caldariorum]